MTQTGSESLRSAGGFAATVFALAFPSVYLFHRHFGLWSVVPYVWFVAAVVAFWRSRWFDAVAVGLGERRARWLAVGSLVGLTAWVALAQRLMATRHFGVGLDYLDAIVRGSSALLHGRFPYAEPTFVGNPITPMPGSLVLAAPFVALGLGAYQSMAWLAMGFLLLRRAFAGDTARALLFGWLVLLACPAIIHRVSTATDYPANSLFVLVFAVGLLASSARDARPWPAVAWAVALGVGLSSRANFAFVLPLVVSRLVQLRGWPWGLALGGVVAAAAAAVTLPIYAWDPLHFSPLHTAGKLREVGGGLPHPEVLIPIFAALVTAVLCRPRWNGSMGAFLRNAAVGQLALSVPRALAWWAGGNVPAWHPTGFGHFAIYFAVGAAAMRCSWRETGGVDDTDRRPAPEL